MVLTALRLAAALAGVAVAAAQTYRHGNSTTIIEQSGDSETRIKRYRDGQSIITEDGNSTDITIQRENGAAATADERDHTDDYFSRRLMEESFSGFGPDNANAGTAGTDFRQRIQQRMRSRFAD